MQGLDQRQRPVAGHPEAPMGAIVMSDFALLAIFVSAFAFANYVYLV